MDIAPQNRRVNGFWVLLLSISMLGASVYLYRILMESVVGSFSIPELYAATTGQVEVQKIALLQSDYTLQSHQLLSTNGSDASWVEVTMQSWRQYLEDQDIPYDEIRDADVELGDLGEYSILILPSTRAMSDREMDQIKAFMERGGSVLATWTPGIFRPDGSWRGWTFIEEAFGVAFVNFAEHNASGYQVYKATFPGTAEPGLYIPRSDESKGDTLAAFSTSGFATSGFAPLRNYERVDTLGATPPMGDYVEAQPFEQTLQNADGTMRTEPRVAMTYYTWVGAALGNQMPYPSTSTSIRRFSLRGDTPLTASIPNSYRVKIQIYNPGVLLKILEPRTKAAGFWYDFATEDRPIDEALAETSGIIYGTYGLGRFVYLGFPRDAMGLGTDDKEDASVLAQLFTNIFDYLMHKPIAWVNEWPAPYKAAATLVGLGENNLTNLAGMGSLMTDQEVTGTFFVRPEAAAMLPDLFKTLAGSHEVGVLDTLVFGTSGSADVQTRRMEANKRLLEKIVGASVAGYRPVQRGRFSKPTQTALADAGFRYFMPDSISRSVAPQSIRVEGVPLVRMGATVRDDRDLYGRLHPDSVHLSTALFEEDVDRVAYEGGLYRLIYSSDLLARPENKGTMVAIIAALRANDYWIDSAENIARWWETQEAVYVRVAERTRTRIVVRISNTRNKPADQLNISVNLGRSVPTVIVRPELINTPLPTYTLSEDNTRLDLLIKELKPNEHRVFYIDLPQEVTTPTLTIQESI